MSGKDLEAYQTSLTTKKAKSVEPALPTADIASARQPGLGESLRRASNNPRRMSSRDILALQRATGNRTVARMMRQATPVPAVQFSLTISAENDPFEQEADRVADQVLSAPESGTPALSALQRQASSEEDEDQLALARSSGSASSSPDVEQDVESRIQSLRGSGDALPEGVRAFMEPRFGADFSQVRIHTGSEAAALNRQVSAQAFTTGQDIFLGDGVGDLDSTAGRHLLAHELTHVLQQSGGAPASQPAAQEESKLETSGLAVPAKDATPKAIGDKEDVPSKKSEAKLTSSVMRLVDTRMLQRVPPPPAPVVVPASRAAINYLAVLKDLTPTGWGVTTEDDAVIDITAYADGAVWKCVITQADQQPHQGVRLMPGVVEVTPALVSGQNDCGKLQTMITSLDTVASQGSDSGFYMISAVQAHEDLHITQYRAALNPAFTTLKTAVEALTIPKGSAADAGAAKTAIKALPAYTAANATFHAADVAANNATAAHNPIAPFSAIEHRVVDPMITTIKARRTVLKCP